ncbi:hypothetical protein [Escherichia coli]|nr:hypothetical protein [Escherichia coli]
MMSLWDALRMNMMISYQELVRTFPKCSTENIVKSATAGNHSILALSKVHQPTAARSCIQRAAVFFMIYAQWTI